MIAGLREREALHAALGRYADPEVARRVLDDPDALAGEEVEVTVMFVDIRGFTSATDGVAPREAVARLNDFFEVVVPVLQAHGGHANKFVGDGLLGVFGVPEHHADHADRALAAALRRAAPRQRRPSAGTCGSASASTPGACSPARSAAAASSSSR